MVMISIEPMLREFIDYRFIRYYISVVIDIQTMVMVI